MDMVWLNKARCLNADPELFFPVGNTGPALEQIEQAKTICRQCDVSAQCLEYAIKETKTRVCGVVYPKTSADL